MSKEGLRNNVKVTKGLIKDVIDGLFRKYDMHTDNTRKKWLLNFCMSEIRENSGLEKELTTKKDVEFFVMLSLFYMMKPFDEQE